MSNSVASLTYGARVPGATRIKIKQLKQGWDFHHAYTRRRFETIKSRNVDPNADPASYVYTQTRYGHIPSSGVDWRWQNRFKVTAYFGSPNAEGVYPSTRSWTFNKSNDGTMTLRCPACIEEARHQERLQTVFVPGTAIPGRHRRGSRSGGS